MSKALGAGMVIVSAVSAGFFVMSAAPASLVAWTSSNVVCQKGDSALLLPTWLWGHVVMEMGCVMIMVLSLLLCSRLQTAATFIVLWLWIRLIWSIYGLLLIFGDHRSCLTQGHAVGWMTLWSIVLTMSSSTLLVLVAAFLF